MLPPLNEKLVEFMAFIGQNKFMSIRYVTIITVILLAAVFIFLDIPRKIEGKTRSTIST